MERDLQNPIMPPRGFPPSEMQLRFRRAQRFLRAARLDAVVLCTEANFYYFTGFLSPFWQSPTRPMFLLVSSSEAAKAPIALVPGIQAETVAQITWLGEKNVRTWPAPRPEDDGVTLLIAEILKLGAVGKSGAGGADSGRQQRGQYTIGIL